MTDEGQKSTLCGALKWLIDNSEGIAGLTVDGSVMPWEQVIDLYLPFDPSEDLDREDPMENVMLYDSDYPK